MATPQVSCVHNESPGDRAAHLQEHASKTERSSDVTLGPWGLSASREKALQSSCELWKATFEVVQSSGDLLESVFDNGRTDSEPLGRPKYRGPPHFLVAVDLESRLAMQRARKVLESANEYNSAKDKLWKLKSEFSMLRLLCVDLEAEIPRSLREAEFWRSGPLEAQAAELKLLSALKPLTPFLKQHGLVRFIQQERNDMISIAMEVSPESLTDPKTGRPIADRILELADMVEKANEAGPAEEEAAIVEKCFWQMWALYEFLHKELTRSVEEVEALRTAAWKENIESKRV
ncbi:hypothetical protein KFL_000780330 [Klebsormidium nitens]|uniref:Uncharacterized protein n=1 Tax=Klebsormidium nitens TaxID=105231 RepID=A0A1Y1HWL5_KLENI|nr:hypothetical protein KFL_000780330 [Klebsormidium nitens]|eukprot:GAQ81371.1 hypothetical protein KFL_000780330 [Klebsormidium nitens]